MANKLNLIIPTSINVLTAVNDSFITESRNNVPLNVTLPSLRRRALLIVKEIGTLPVQTFIPDTTNYTR